MSVNSNARRNREDSFYWNIQDKKAVGELEFEVGYKHWKKVPFELFLGEEASPYPFPFSTAIPSLDHVKHVEIARGPMGRPNRLLVHGANKPSIGLFLEPDLLHFIRVDDSNWPECLDFRIEYIGISTGENGQRDYADRLSNHEKVRETAGIIQRDAPNLQVYVFGYKASYVIEPVPQHFITGSGILEARIGMPDFAKVLEAALIGHFRPAFNDEFKKFPDGTPPHWVHTLKDIIRPSDELPGKAILSVVIASDNRHNPEGPWTFGRFYTDHTLLRGGPTDLSQSRSICPPCRRRRTRLGKMHMTPVRWSQSNNAASVCSFHPERANATRSRHDWKSAMTQFALLYPERFNIGV
ncbi:hypothetical protein [Burkholderia sp. Bp9004]|uniref:hypothetical protein n=1 Tax=Burkholderia sp. Bp9004 TaxID=2184559 RepID=UPI00269E735E|nr:hypothetical protein [Burkholderia sp. Bp9004]